jgi:hypothetical protein
MRTRLVKGRLTEVLNLTRFGQGQGQAHGQVWICIYAITYSCAFIAFLLFALQGCSRCNRGDESDHLAELVEKKGGVERDWAEKLNAWQTASQGALFDVGDGVRARGLSEAVLKLSEGSFARLKANSMIRFLRTMPGSKVKGIDLQQGEAEIEVGNSALQLMSRVGTAVIEAGTTVHMRKSDKGVEFFVAIGTATFETKAKESIRLGAGEGIRIGIGEAVLARYSESQKEKPANVSVQTGRVKVEQPDQTRALGAGEEATIINSKERDSDANSALVDTDPSFADFSIKAGESFVVHSAKPPVAIEFEFKNQCPNGAVAQLVGQTMRSRGTSSAKLLLQAGHSKYVIRCLEADGTARPKPVASGSVTVLRDPGTDDLPRKAPLSQVDADGRNYTILYQNQLPIITVRWPAAPKTGSYILSIDSPSLGHREFKTDKSDHTFESGELRDGVHRISFKAENSSITSKTTSIDIRFDNAAPKVRLRDPKEGQFRVGDRVTVAGIAVPGWTIELARGTISTDEQNRFIGEVTYTKPYRAIALRIANPRRGIHYYLRRGQSNTP